MFGKMWHLDTRHFKDVYSWDGFEENSSNIVNDEEFELFYDENKSENLKFLIGTTNDLI